MSERPVLVTGVAGFWGREVATRLLAATDGLAVIGLDVCLPEGEIPGLDFIQADVRSPLLLDLLREEGVTEVCHLAWRDTTHPSEAAFEANVLGTERLLAACAAAGVRRVVLRSSTAVYGARPVNAAFLTEDQPLHGSPSWGSLRDLIEVEHFLADFRAQAPDLSVCVLRLAQVVGATVDSPLTRFLEATDLPTLLGFDPLMQAIHEDDAVQALAAALVSEVQGAVNVAAPDRLPLSRLLALAGRMRLPQAHPLAYWRARWGLSGAIPAQLDYLRYPCLADLTRMQQELDFAPSHSAEAALREFAAVQRLSHYLPPLESQVYDDRRLRDILERRRQARVTSAAVSTSPEASDDRL